MQGPEEPTPLTTSQKSRVRRKFRAAYLIEDEAQHIIDEHGTEYRPTYYPKCRRKLRSYVIPQHRDAEGYICKAP